MNDKKENEKQKEEMEDRVLKCLGEHPDGALIVSIVDTVFGRYACTNAGRIRIIRQCLFELREKAKAEVNKSDPLRWKRMALPTQKFVTRTATATTTATTRPQSVPTAAKAKAKVRPKSVRTMTATAVTPTATTPISLCLSRIRIAYTAFGNQPMEALLATWSWQGVTQPVTLDRLLRDPHFVTHVEALLLQTLDSKLDPPRLLSAPYQLSYERMDVNLTLCSA
jgi:hypothetical protein